MPIYRITKELIDEVSTGFATLHSLNLSHNCARPRAPPQAIPASARRARAHARRAGLTPRRRARARLQ